MGVKVAKHGNKAVSSNCGSADVLQALKININLKPNEVEENINNEDNDLDLIDEDLNDKNDFSLEIDDETDDSTENEK